MSPLCPAPDATLGTVERLARFLDCNARLLGENGYQALAGDVVTSGLVTALVTILVAVVGLRLLVGQKASLSDGIGLSFRLGLALALATSWPAFQAVVYRVAIDGPAQLASVIAPGVGLPDQSREQRAQRAYDSIRLGAQALPAGQAAPPTAIAANPGALALFQVAPALPRTATAFMIGTVGIEGVLRLVAGFLLAIGPLAVLALLFTGSAGLTVGWVRALAGTALAALAARLVGALHLVMVEAELERVRALGSLASANAIDVGALSGIVTLFVLAALASAYAAFRTASAIDWRTGAARSEWLHQSGKGLAGRLASHGAAGRGAALAAGSPRDQGRIAGMVDALENAARREARLLAASPALAGPQRTGTERNDAARGASAPPLGAGARRGSARSSRQARQRDEKR